MPAFRNVKARRPSGRISDPQLWNRNFTHPPREEIYSPSLTPPTPSPVDYDGEYHIPVKAKSSRRNDADHIPRPRNAFILFRSYLNQKSGGPDQNQVSVVAGKIWNKFSDEEKQPFHLLAQKEKRDHQTKYPNYTYSPTTRSGGTKRKPVSKKKAKPSPKKPLAVALNHIEDALPVHTPLRSCDSTPPQPAEIVIPSIASFIPPVKRSPEPMLDLTEISTSLSEHFSILDMTFVPTSEIPPLELSPHKAEKTTEFDASLQLPAYSRIDEPFDPKETIAPSMEDFMLLDVMAELDFDYPEIFRFMGDSTSPFVPDQTQYHSDWNTPQQTMSFEHWDYSYMNHGITHDAPTNIFTNPFATHAAEQERERYTISSTTSTTHITPTEENLMNQFLNFDD